MAGSPPEHHMDRLGHRLGYRSDNHVLAPEERMTMRVRSAVMAPDRSDGPMKLHVSDY